MNSYLDCPLRSDEVGCFGCDQRSYSCSNNNEEYDRAKLSSGGSMCYSLAQKCDGFTDCITGKDEEECSMLIKQVGLHTVNHFETASSFNFNIQTIIVNNNDNKLL